MQLLRVRHLTRYRYARPVRFGEHRMMLRPREYADQTLIQERLAITPEPTELNFIRDGLGNWIGVARFDGEASELCFESEIEVARRPSRAGVGSGSQPSRRPTRERAGRAAHAAGPVTDWARSFAPSGTPPGLEALQAMNREIHAGFAYRRRLEHGVQPPARTLATRSGACRDFAVLMIAAARGLGLQARFVSGYLHCPDEPGGRPAQAGGHTHAWVSIRTREHGWIDFDPTSGSTGPAGLVRVAIADEPSDATPVRGIYFGAASDFLGMDVEVRVAAGVEQVLERGIGEPPPSPRVAGRAA